jgi:hypothetical protein
MLLPSVAYMKELDFGETTDLSIHKTQKQCYKEEEEEEEEEERKDGGGGGGGGDDDDDDDDNDLFCNYLYPHGSRT